MYDFMSEGTFLCDKENPERSLSIIKATKLTDSTPFKCKIMKENKQK